MVRLVRMNMTLKMMEWKSREIIDEPRFIQISEGRQTRPRKHTEGD
jgi:hypothetical protein